MAISIKQLALVAVLLLAVSALVATAEVCDAEGTNDGLVIEPYPYGGNDDEAIVVGYTGTSSDVDIPSSVTINDKTYSVVAIGDAFYGNEVVESVTIPSTVEVVDSSAFYSCPNLEYVFINGSPNIGTYAFFGCSSLSFIDLKHQVEADKTSFMLGNGTSCTVRAPSGVNIDEYGVGTEFTYIAPSDYLVRYTAVGAPEEVGEFGFDVVKAGSSVTLPEGAVVTGYDVSMTVGSTPVDENYKSPASDITVTLTYTLKQYTVTFAVDGETVQTLTLKHGDTITAPATNPTKEQDEKNTYTFAGWEGFTEGMKATQNVTFDAKFTETPRTYTVSFVSEGVPVQTQTLAYGAVITAPADDPVKESEQGVDYRFVRWDGFTEGMTVTGDATFTAKFDSTDHVYTIQFVSDGEVVSTLQLGYGDTITAPAENPVKESAGGVDYVFAGWDGFTEDMTVTGDMTFEAVFDEVPQDDGGDSTWIYVAVVIVVVLVVLALVVLRKHL